MQNHFTPDGLLVLSAILIAILLTLLWIFHKARTSNGIAELPSFLLFGWGGAAWSPNIIVISKDYLNKTALIAHEKHHQKQQLRDGTLTFWFKYLTSKEYRFNMELEAYKVWVQVSPKDTENVINWMINSYGFNVTRDELRILLKEPLVD
jgi:hypothetical protein